MPLSLSSTAIQEKNKLATDSVWHLLLKITIPGEATPIRVCSDNQDVTWNSATWQPFPFEIDEINDDSKGEVPRVDLRISNVSRVIDQYVLAYDSYVKTYGFQPITVILYIVNSKNLASSTPEVEYWFELKSPKVNAKWATFTLGAINPYNRRYPQDRIMKNQCRHIFQGQNCGYRETGNNYLNDFESNVNGLLVETGTVTITSSDSYYGHNCALVVWGGTGNNQVYDYCTGPSSNSNVGSSSIWTVSYKVKRADGGVVQSDYCHMWNYTGSSAYTQTSCVTQLENGWYKVTAVMSWHSSSPQPLGLNGPHFTDAATVHYVDGWSIYSGTGTVVSSCNKTFSRCGSLENELRFGGFPGVGRGGVPIYGG